MRGLALAAALVTAAPAMAQIGALPLDTQSALRGTGPVLSPEALRATVSALAPLHPQDAHGVRMTADIRYGSDPRHRLDVFAPSQGALGLPVLVFIHGGGFIAGDKRRDDSFFYQNIGSWAARNGLVGINATYRLAPQHPWPAGTEDVAAAVAWVRANVAQHGGDQQNIVLMGHSAGASHVASYVAHRQFHPAGGSGVAGAVLVSGLYDVVATRGQGSNGQYYGSDPSRWPGQSAMAGLAETTTPLLLVRAELDPPWFVAQTTNQEAALCGRGAGRCARALVLRGHNHYSTVMTIGTADREFGDAILRFAKASR